MWAACFTIHLGNMILFPFCVNKKHTDSVESFPDPWSKHRIIGNLRFSS